MEIKSAKFVISNTELSKAPKDGRSEYAFIGRSNVGKSSLINMLTQQSNLAKTSQTPGKTKLINHFLINDDFYIVDLPGYGYAKMPKAAQQELKRIIEGYIYRRQELVNLFVLIDIRHAPLPIDLQFIQAMGEHSIPFSIVFTKADKLGFEARKLKLQAYKDKLSETWDELPPIFVTSSSKGEGREELLNYIGQIEEEIKA